ncbi:MAG: hypothetical protein H7144_06650 [Burkholderiales bacterium]|nr:hypothetical protein [Phycisphaerae bacterium]
MFSKLRKKLQGNGGKVAGGVLSIVAVYALWTSILSTFGDNEAEAAARNRYFICSETGKSFSLTIEQNMSWPVQSPYSGKKTGYPAEPCYWTKDGQIKSTPTWVLVNHYLAKKGPTYCPECGRLVKPQNPPPLKDAPPPTAKENTSRSARSE